MAKKNNKLLDTSHDRRIRLYFDNLVAEVKSMEGDIDKVMKSNNLSAIKRSIMKSNNIRRRTSLELHLKLGELKKQILKEQSIK